MNFMSLTRSFLLLAGVGFVIADSTDYQALSAVAAANQNFNISGSWILSDPCNGQQWVGVFCDSQSRVTEIRLPSSLLSGSIPKELSGLQSITKLDLQNNSLSGSIPPELGRITSLINLDLSLNKLEGSIPSQLYNLSNLQSLYLQKNSLSGGIAPEIGNVTSLTDLRLYGNKLQGLLPSQLSALSKLKWMDLSGNQLSGPIPVELSKLTSITFFGLHYNQFSGSIPQELSGLLNITYLGLQYNKLSGPIPVSLSALTSVSYFGLRYNQLNGSIPKELSSLRSVTHLGLQSNKLSGEIPSSLSALSNAKDFLLGDNQLNGTIPQELGLLTGLQTLDLSRNRLSGTVPIQINNLANTIVDLTFNYLVGQPGKFSANLTCNCLSGPVTLLGPQRQNGCPSSNVPLLSSKHSANVAIIVGSAIAAVVLLALFLALCMWCRVRTPTSHCATSLTIPDTSVKKWKFSELQAATSNFDQACKIGKGGFATVYKATLAGEVVAVKRLMDKNMQLQRQQDFVKEVEVIGNIHNRNLVALQGYCMEGDECLLVYDYLANGSLEDALFGSKGPLSWPICVKILVGTASAVAYLHEGCKEKIIHRDIKPANVLLDHEFNPYVADFGLVRTSSLADTHVSTRVAGTMGYLAPEYTLTGQLTEKSDVYSFGVLMLVVIGHRNAVDTSGRDSFVSIVERAYRMAESNNLLDLVAPHLVESTYNEEQAMRFFSIAFLCIQASWQKRPTMGHVVQMLNGNLEIPALDLNQADPRSLVLRGYPVYSENSYVWSSGGYSTSGTV